MKKRTPPRMKELSWTAQCSCSCGCNNDEHITVTVKSLFLSFKLLWDGLGLGPVEEFLLLGCLVIYGEYNLARFTNFESVGNNGLISGTNFPVLLNYDSVTILSAGNKFSTVADIPAHHSDFPNSMTFLQFSDIFLLVPSPALLLKKRTKRKRSIEWPQKQGTQQHA